MGRSDRQACFDSSIKNVRRTREEFLLCHRMCTRAHGQPKTRNADSYPIERKCAHAHVACGAQSTGSGSARAAHLSLNALHSGASRPRHQYSPPRLAYKVTDSGAQSPPTARRMSSVIQWSHRPHTTGTACEQPASRAACAGARGRTHWTLSRSLTRALSALAICPVCALAPLLCKFPHALRMPSHMTPHNIIIIHARGRRARERAASSLQRACTSARREMEAR